MFHALLALTIASPHSAASPPSETNGVCDSPGNVSCACTSSATTSTPCRAASVATAASSSRVKIVPVGLCGLQSTNARAPAANASPSAPRSRCAEASSGTSTTCLLIERVTVKNGG